MLDRYLALYLETEDLKEFSKCFKLKNKNHVLGEIKLGENTVHLTSNELSQYQKVKKENKDKEPRILKLYKQATTITYNKSMAFKIINELETHSNFLAVTLRSYLYLISGNSVRAEFLLQKYMQKEFIEHVYSSDLSQLTIEKQIELSLDILKKIKEDISNKKVFDTFIFYLYHNSDGLFKEAIEDEFETKSGIRFVRTKFSSVTYGRPFPYVWGPIIFEESSRKEYSKLLKYSKVSDKLKNNEPGYLIFYRSFGKMTKSEKELLLNSFKSISSKNNFYTQEVKFRMLDNDLFYQFLKANSQEKFGLILNKKRRFYQNYLNKNYALSYVIYRLFQMGDIQTSYYLKALHFETRRL